MGREGLGLVERKGDTRLRRSPGQLGRSLGTGDSASRQVGRTQVGPGGREWSGCRREGLQGARPPPGPHRTVTDVYVPRPLVPLAESRLIVHLREEDPELEGGGSPQRHKPAGAGGVGTVARGESSQGGLEVGCGRGRCWNRGAPAGGGVEREGVSGFTLDPGGQGLGNPSKDSSPSAHQRGHLGEAPRLI